MQKDRCNICLWSFTLREVFSMPSFLSPLICGKSFNVEVGDRHINGSGVSVFIGDLARDGLIGEEFSVGLVSESILE